MTDDVVDKYDRSCSLFDVRMVCAAGPTGFVALALPINLYFLHLQLTLTLDWQFTLTFKKSESST